MSAFEIEIEPAVRESAQSYDPDLIYKLDFQTIEAVFQQEFSLFYSFSGRRFGYYPSSIITIINDVHLEWTNIVSRKSHEIKICGYTVLLMDMEHDIASVFVPSLDDRKEVGMGLDAGLLERKFRSKLNDLYGLIKSEAPLAN